MHECKTYVRSMHSFLNNWKSVIFDDLYSFILENRNSFPLDVSKRFFLNNWNRFLLNNWTSFNLDDWYSCILDSSLFFEERFCDNQVNMYIIEAVM
jgi:hypothetical protein